MKRAALYVRVSTQEQKKHGLSVDSQIDALNEYCKEHKYEVVNVYNDAGISARKKYLKRPALLQLMEDCKDGKVDIILFTKLDRWFRSVGDYYEVQKILDDSKVPWRAIWEDYETETSSGVFKVNIMLSVAQSEADRTSERIKAVNDYRRAQGIYTSGKVPLGYKVNKGVITKDEESRKGIEEFFDFYERTLNIPMAMDKAKALGVSFTRQTATRMLQNEAYTGKSHGAEFEPYITLEQYNRNIETIKGRKTRPPKEKKHLYLYSGLIKCAHCGGSVAGKTRYMQSGKNVKAYKYYKCSRHTNRVCDNNRSITEMKVERFLLNNLNALIDKYKAAADTSQAGVVDYSLQIKSLENKLKRIGDRYEDGDISREEYKEKRFKVQSEINELKSKVAPKRELKKLPSNWLDIYKELDELHKREFWVAILNYMELDVNGDITVHFD